MHRLKSLEKEIKAHEYCSDQIGYCFCCEFVDMALDDLEPLKELLVKHKINGPDARNLSDWSSIRVLQKGNQFAELEFYICD